MTPENDRLLSSLTVKIQDPATDATLGSGVIYNDNSLKDKVYVISAGHTFYKDSDTFTEKFQDVKLSFYNAQKDQYVPLVVPINYDLISPEMDKDFGIIILNRALIETALGKIPEITVVRDRQSVLEFYCKGFPMATQGKELAVIKPLWSQQLPEVNKFQLSLQEDYLASRVKGFSGAGIFVSQNDKLYLLGIFTRYRTENNGRIIYCQYIETINEKLKEAFCPLIKFSFLPQGAFDMDFFQTQVSRAVKNLGPRYNAALNFRLPVAKFFDEMERNNEFKTSLEITIDNWLLERHYQPDNKLLDPIEEENEQIKQAVTKWILDFQWKPENIIDFKSHEDELEKLEQLIDNKISEFYSLQFEAQKIEKEKKQIPISLPFDSEIHWLREIRSGNRKFLSHLHGLGISLSNNPFLLLNGEAGCGKSHLLGDIATSRIKNSHPVLLVLGQLFKRDRSVWENIQNQIGVQGTPAAYLSNLNNIGKQIGKRILFLIDAINEGRGKTVWRDEMEGFIQDISAYPYIGVCLTIRNTYLNSTVPAALLADSKVTRKEHFGFRGNEYKALKFFCENYDLEQPNIPLLTPEFSNPLFLTLICKELFESGTKKFPKGFQNISKIFRVFLENICARLEQKRDAYSSRKHDILAAVHLIAMACYERSSRVINLEAAHKLLDKHYPNFPDLLSDLILENVFTQNMRMDYTIEQEEEVLYFAYERMGDYYIAEKLLSAYYNESDVTTAFKKENILGNLLLKNIHRNQGILEAFAVMLPEKFGLEIYEVYDWVRTSRDQRVPSHAKRLLNELMLESLKWRSISSINEEKLLMRMRDKTFNIKWQALSNYLLELSTQVDHPFNNDFLTSRIFLQPMPKRDGTWQPIFRDLTFSDDEGNAGVLRRLIDWAWSPGISDKADFETARLSAQTLTWILSSACRQVRDQTTKALVNLLEQKPDALVSVLKAFDHVDDPYISERLYAVAYGCVLRTRNIESIKAIAQAVFDLVFKNNNLPVHILLRDYARNTVEYALYRGIKIEGNIKAIYPPYKSSMPLSFPTKADILKNKIDYNDPNYKRDNGYSQNRIIESVTNDDFGRYTIQSAIHHFFPVSFTLERRYLRLKNKTPDDGKVLMKSIEQAFKKETYIRNKIKQNYSNVSELESQLNQLKLECDKSLEQLSAKISAKDYKSFQSYIPHFKSQNLSNNYNHRTYFNSTPIQNWIVQRVFELGYDAKVHGEFDGSVSNYSRTSEHAIERIGKKYQWIAFHEIMARISDNFKLESEYLDGRKKPYYNGPWPLYLRDIDPSFTTKKQVLDDEISVDSNELTAEDSNWWVDKNYNHWDLPNSKWINMDKDLPVPQDIIARKDSDGVDWLYLNTNLRWREPKKIGEDRYNSGKKEIWYMVQSYIVHKDQKSQIVDSLKGKNFFGRNLLPETNGTEVSLINRENYWSPAANENPEEIWKNIRGVKSKVMVATSEAVGEFSSDLSGAHFKYEMPCKLLFSGMKLLYGELDGQFRDLHGNLIVQRPDKNGMLIRKEHLLNFLKQHNYDMIWTILGEKNAVDKSDRDWHYAKVVNCVYAFEDNKLTGDLWLTDRN